MGSRTVWPGSGSGRGCLSGGGHGGGCLNGVGRGGSGGGSCWLCCWIGGAFLVWQAIFPCPTSNFVEHVVKTIQYLCAVSGH